jgi:hypothetical protein
MPLCHQAPKKKKSRCREYECTLTFCCFTRASLCHRSTRETACLYAIEHTHTLSLSPTHTHCFTRASLCHRSTRKTACLYAMQHTHTLSLSLSHSLLHACLSMPRSTRATACLYATEHTHTLSHTHTQQHASMRRSTSFTRASMPASTCWWCANTEARVKQVLQRHA